MLRLPTFSELKVGQEYLLFHAIRRLKRLPTLRKLGLIISNRSGTNVSSLGPKILLKGVSAQP